jgi:hypothetical protein
LKNNDYSVSPEVTDIMEKVVKTFPSVFPGFDINKIISVHTKNKKSKSNKCPINLKPVRYPYDILIDKTYICEVMDDTWNDMTDKQRNLAVFHTMCAIPEGAFDEASKSYAKKKAPDYHIYAEEFAVTGGVPNWMENPDTRDVFDAKNDNIKRAAVTADSVANLDEDEE